MAIIDTLSDVSSSDTDAQSNISSACATQLESNIIRTSRRIRKKKRSKPPITDDATLLRYWNRRYDLFERFDLGVQLDKESWYSVTPECIARRQANACACDLIVDAFAGVGGNAIQFARTCSLVVAIDNNYTRLLLLKHNAQVYGVSHNILPICGDAVSIICSLRSSKVPISDPSSSAQTSTAESAPNENCLPEAGLDVVRVEQPQDLPPTIVDVIFLSPPWGGPGYTGVVLPPGSSSWNKRKRRHWFQSSGNAVEPTKNLENIPLLLPALRAACHICHRILVYLPRSCSIGQMLRLSWPSDKCDCQMCGQYRAVSLEEYLVRGRRVALGLHIGTTLE